MNNQQFPDWLQQISCSDLSSYPPKPLVMGILNITPDSFSDGGLYLDPAAALHQARTIIAEGADIIDIGGESTKPGAIPVAAEEEIARVIPVIKRLREESDICISIDTSKAAVMRAAVEAGATMINDIAALADKDSIRTAADLGVPVCLMHMHGQPATMQDNPEYSEDIMEEINAFFQARIARCLDAGIHRTNLIIDPGFGFGKTVEHNLRLTANIASFHKHGLPVMLGVSRKSTLGAILNKAVDERLIAGIAMAVYATLQGVALIRTHDVSETNQALAVVEALLQAKIPPFDLKGTER